MPDELRQAITLIKAGEKRKGGKILAGLIKADPKNERAWLWMSQVVQTEQQQIHCLRQVLAINPANKTAQKALASFQQKKPVPLPKRKAPSRQAESPRSRLARRRRTQFTLALITGLLLFFMVGYFAFQRYQFRTDVAPLAEVCQGRWNDKAAPYSPAKGLHPAIGLEQHKDVWTVSMWHIPWEAQAGSLAETELVLCLEKVEKVFIESCPYSKTGRGRATNWINRYYNKQQVKLIAAKTGQVIGAQIFKSRNSGRGCEDTERFASSERVISIDGTPISGVEISNWAESKIIIE